MAEDSKGRLVIVEWDVSTREIDENKLKNFIKANSETEPVIKLSTHRRVALLKFTEEKDAHFLRNQWKDDGFWTVTKVCVVPETKKVKVTNLPKSAKRVDVYKFFTNENMVNLKLNLEIKEDYFHPNNGLCVLHMTSADDVKNACGTCETLKKFRTCTLALEPYYEELESLDELSKVCKDDQISQITIENIDNMKLKYMKDFCRTSIEQQFKSACAKIFWAKEGINKVQIKFACEHEEKRLEHCDVWENHVRQLLQHLLDDIVIIRKNLSGDVWDQVQIMLTSIRLESALIDEDAELYRLIIVGQKYNSYIAKVEKDIDAIQPPKSLQKLEVKFSDKIKVSAFSDLEMGETIGGVTVDCKVRTGVIKIQGDRDTIRKAKIEILQVLKQIVVQSSDLSSKEAATILTTQLMRAKIEVSKDDQGERCGYLIEKGKLFVFSNDQTDLDKFENTIKALVVETDRTLQGKIESENILKKKIKEIEDSYSPYVTLNYKKSKENLVIHIVCGTDHYGSVCDDLNEMIESLLIKEEEIHISPYSVKHIQNNSLKRIQDSIKSLKLPKDAFESDMQNGTLKAKGNAGIRHQVVDIVKMEAKKIYISWKTIEGEGINDYLGDGEGLKFLMNERNNHQCGFQIATQYEMKNAEMYCIVPLETGQSLFVGTGTLTNPTIAVDVIVNATNVRLEHRGGLAAALVKAGGQSIQDDCTDYIKQNGELQPGGIYIGTPGNLPCQRIIHAVGPQWKGGNSNEDETLQTVVENIIEAMNKDKEYILRSVAMPLISAGVFGFPWFRSAKVILQTMQTKLKLSTNVREIFFYDPNPDIVRTIQEQMHGIFESRCFHLSVRSIAVDKGPMTRYPVSTHFKLERTGTITLPLPGDSKIIIKWGELHSTSADVLVNATSTAPKPSGKVSDGLKYAAGVKFGLEIECSRAFKRVHPDGNVPPETMVRTKAGRLPCNEIYHIKINRSWDSNTGCNSLADYIKICLKEAVRKKRTSIAFPMIGTADCGYPGEQVALTFIRTIGEFMQLHITCSLTEITVVIHKKDAANTRAFEVILEQLYKQRPHRLYKPKQRPPSPKRPKSGIYRNKAQTQNEGSFAVDGTDGVIVALEIGSIEKSKVEAIVCTSSSFPRLNGAIPSAIMKAGGPDIQKECNRCYKSFPIRGVAVTTAGNLNCKKVFYIVLKDYNPANAKSVYESVLGCLQQAETEQFSSIAMPTLGTGGFQYPDQVSASQMFQAIKEFFKTKRSFLKLIVTVMYGPAQQTHKTFYQEAAQFFTQMKAPTEAVAGAAQAYKSQNGSVRRAEESGNQDKNDDIDDIAIPSKRRDFVLIQFTSDERKHVDLAFQSITAKVSRERKDVDIDLTKDRNIDDLELLTADKGQNKNMIEDIGEDHHVRVFVDQKARKIKVSGLGDGVIKCYERILRFLQERRKEAVSKDIGKIVYQHIEWYYTEDDGKMWVPYPRHVGFMLEDAYDSKDSEKEFRDNDDNLYVVDFTKMEEYVKKKREKETTVTVIRKDLTKGSLRTLPLTWQAMGESENLSEVLLNSTDSEYKDVEANFRKTLGSYKLSQIKEIRRIQNLTLYQQYQTKKDQLKTEHKNASGIQIERILWHGTREDTEQSITSNGFNRSYAGATFEGKVSYGIGVYFAVNSEYSIGDSYSPPDSGGWRRVYQVKVLTGLSKEVDRGYKERYAPLVPGSQIDRYNSTCDSIKNPAEFVIYSDTQAYPEYIILFK